MGSVHRRYRQRGLGHGEWIALTCVLCIGLLVACGDTPADNPVKPPEMPEPPSSLERFRTRIETSGVPLQAMALQVDPAVLGAHTGQGYAAKDHPIEIELFVFDSGEQTMNAWRQSRASGWDAPVTAHLIVRGPALLRIRQTATSDNEAEAALRVIVKAFDGAH